MEEFGSPDDHLQPRSIRFICEFRFRRSHFGADHPRSSIIQGVIISSGGAPGSVVGAGWNSNGTGPPRCFAPSSSFFLPSPSLSPRQHGQQGRALKRSLTHNLALSLTALSLLTPLTLSQPLSRSPSHGS